METVTIKKVRQGTELAFAVILRDSGQSIAWGDLDCVNCQLYSDAQQRSAGRFQVDGVNPLDPFKLNIRYFAGQPQYLGVNRLIITCLYEGEVKTLDVPCVEFVASSEDIGTDVAPASDADLTVEAEDTSAGDEIAIDVEDTSESFFRVVAHVDMAQLLALRGRDDLSSDEFSDVVSPADYLRILDKQIFRVALDEDVSVYTTISEAAIDDSGSSFSFFHDSRLYTLGYNAISQKFFINFKTIRLMASRTVDGEAIFQVPASGFGISPSTSGYTLNFSADGENFTPYEQATEANVNEVVVNAPAGLYFKLVGNTDVVEILY